jgi:hypothetical protein
VTLMFYIPSKYHIHGHLGWAFESSGSSLALIFYIHMHSGPIYWGVIYLAKKITRWWYFTCKKPQIIICDGILHVNMSHYFKISYFTCTFFTKFTYNEYIGPYFLSHGVLRFSRVISSRCMLGVVTESSLKELFIYFVAITSIRVLGNWSTSLKTCPMWLKHLQI